MLQSAMFVVRCRLAGWVTFLLLTWSTSCTGKPVADVDAARDRQRSESMKLSSGGRLAARSRRQLLANPVDDDPRATDGLTPDNRGNC